MHIFCTYTQKWMQREKKNSKNKTKRLRGDTDTKLHQVIREKGFYNMTLNISVISILLGLLINSHIL
jgi:hypothetical protein